MSRRVHRTAQLVIQVYPPFAGNGWRVPLVLNIILRVIGRVTSKQFRLVLSSIHLSLKGPILSETSYDRDAQWAVLHHRQLAFPVDFWYLDSDGYTAVLGDGNEGRTEARNLTPSISNAKPTKYCVMLHWRPYFPLS